MSQYTPIVATITAGLVLAFVFGAIANRLRLPTTVGYLVAGILVGPFTPGFVADQWIASQLAEIGVILLMFGVGLHFSFKDILLVRAIAIPGALLQMSAATILGMALALLFGWSLSAGLVYGLTLSVASTVVLVRALQEHRLVETERGHIALGWLVVQDLVMVLALVLLPALADALNLNPGAGAEAASSTSSARDVIAALGTTIAKVTAFLALMLVIGRRVIPWILHYVAHTGSRELFRLAVLSIALGVAYGASEWFGISIALGAFFAGMIMHESPLSQRAAEESLPLRDAFAVLFFVSVGMLFDPSIFIRDPFALAGTLFIILICNPGAAFVIAQSFGRSKFTSLTLAASLAQIGEFSFILSGLGVALGLLPTEARDLVLAGAIISIFANPILFGALERWGRRFAREAPSAEPAAAANPVEELRPTALKDHAVIVGYGRVGRVIGEELERRKEPLLVIEEQPKIAAELRSRGIEVITENGAMSRVLEASNLDGARWLFVAIPDAFEAGQIVNQAREISATLPIIARAHSDAEVDHLTAHGASYTIMGEREIALGMLEYALGRGAMEARGGPAAPAR
ncbi:MAG: YbaL family putative K(+) efflux transporter [Xanthobacteraceae bacterium]